MVVLTVVTIACCSLSIPAAMASIPSGTGYRDFSFSATEVSAPSVPKSESKLWFNDGIWWGSLFNKSSQKYQIHRYDWSAHVERYRGGHRRTQLVEGRRSLGRQPSLRGRRRTARHASKLQCPPRALRYDASTKHYSLDAGFPTTVSNVGMEAIVLARDTTGKLRVTYPQNSQIYISHTLGDDVSWTKPPVLPVEGTTVDPDD